jgi:Transposase IS66 family
VDNRVNLAVCKCPECGAGVSVVPGAVVKREQIAELVRKPVEVTEEDFAGILSTDCWSAYDKQSASTKQKCWAHIERELKRMEKSHWRKCKLNAQKLRLSLSRC